MIIIRKKIQVVIITRIRIRTTTDCSESYKQSNCNKLNRTKCTNLTKTRGIFVFETPSICFVTSTPPGRRRRLERYPPGQTGPGPLTLSGHATGGSMLTLVRPTGHMRLRPPQLITRGAYGAVNHLPVVGYFFVF